MTTIRKLRYAGFGLAALSLLLACAEAEAPLPEVIRSVLVARVAEPGGERERVLTGVTQSVRTTDLSFRVQGEIVNLAVKSGDIVPAGALVAELDRTGFTIERLEALAALTQAEAEVRNAEASYARARALYEREGIARTDLDSARAAAESGRAGVQAAVQRLRAAARQLGFARLVTPSAGAISAVPVELSENVSAGQVVAKLRTGGPPEIEVAFPEVLIAHAAVGAKVSAVIEAFPDEVYAGEVRKVGIAPADGGATFPVTVSLQADWDRIRPGMAAEVRFRFTQAARDGVVVPASAVGQDGDGHYVYAVEPSVGGAAGSSLHTTRRIAVEVAAIGESGFTIRQGLRGGERIAVAGVPRIRDGLTVRVLADGDWP